MRARNPDYNLFSLFSFLSFITKILWLKEKWNFILKGKFLNYLKIFSRKVKNIKNIYLNNDARRVSFEIYIF